MREKTKNKKRQWFPLVFWLIFTAVMFIGNGRETFPDWLQIVIQVYLAFGIIVCLANLFKELIFRKKEVPPYLKWCFFDIVSSSREKTLEERYAEMLESEEEEEDDDVSKIALNSIEKTSIEK